MEFTEFELLTLREGLYTLKNNSPETITEIEFKQIDSKIKIILESM